MRTYEGLVTFGHSEAVWQAHEDQRGNLCGGRIVRLMYPWKHEYVTTDLFLCLDCSRVGIRADEDVDDYQDPQEFLPSTKVKA